MIHPAHAELRKLLTGLAKYPLDGEVLSILHAGRRVAHAAEPLDGPLDAALQRCTTWADLLAIVRNWGADE